MKLRWFIQRNEGVTSEDVCGFAVRMGISLGAAKAVLINEQPPVLQMFSEDSNTWVNIPIVTGQDSDRD